MNKYIGIDLGTSSVKILIVDANGVVLDSVTEEYDIYYPKDGWSEQDPNDWFDKTIIGLHKITKNHKRDDIKGLSIAGQMHGLVCLDDNDNVIRRAILWNDGRSYKETDYLNEQNNIDFLVSNTGNIAFSGFTLPKLLWLRNNEYENYKKIRKIMLPKDYLIYKFTGNFVSDYSDASGTLLLDVKNKKWSENILNKYNIKKEWLPDLHESYKKIGIVKKEIAKLIGFNDCVFVATGGGDNAIGAIGTGTVSNGDCVISLGTSGTIFIASEKYLNLKNNAIHSFCHANGKFHAMACILSAASCYSWWCKNILENCDFLLEQAGISMNIKKNKVFFLPYLMGERSPHNDVNAKSAFIGMTPATTRKDLSLSIMEGVAFAFKDNIEILKNANLPIDSIKISGGGSKSDIWCKIIANILNVNVVRLNIEEGPSYGAALISMFANEEFKSLDEISKRIIKQKSIIYPEKDLVDFYEEKYNTFKRIYPALKEIFK